MNPPLEEAVSPAVTLAQFVRVLFTQFIRGGLRDVVISPGSRSTPLVLEALRREELTCHSVIDERSAGFFALGLSRSSGRTPLLLCTSGSAGAHYLPAIIEAHYAEVPLLVITADRPARLQECGAPQTIAQRGLFGQFATLLPDFGEPRPDLARLLEVGLSASLGMRQARSAVPGPVHINCRLDKPLEPEEPRTQAEHHFAKQVGELLAASPLLPASRSVTSLDSKARLSAASTDATDPEIVRAFFRRSLPAGRTNIIAVGPAPVAVVTAARELAQRAGVPCLSEFPTGGGASPLEFLPSLWARGLGGGAPENILHVGVPCVSSAWATFLSGYPGGYFVLSGGRLREPSHTAKSVLLGELTQCLGLGIEALAGSTTEAPRSSSLDEALAAWPAQVDATLERCASPHAGLSEPGVVQRLLRAAAARGADLMLGNSLPIRLASWVGPTLTHSPRELHVARGANGIDGWLAAAAGSAAGSLRPTLALVGDVTAAHDVGSLALCRKVQTPLVVAILDNGGGRLFDHLPVQGAARAEEFAYWRTEPAINWEAATRAFGARYQRCSSLDESEQYAREALEFPGFTLLHLPTNPESTGEFLRLLRQGAGS